MKKQTDPIQVIRDELARLQERRRAIVRELATLEVDEGFCTDYTSRKSASAKIGNRKSQITHIVWKLRVLKDELFLKRARAGQI